MFLEAASLLYPCLPGGFVAATLRHFEPAGDDVRAALARRLMGVQGYVADVPALQRVRGASSADRLS